MKSRREATRAFNRRDGTELTWYRFMRPHDPELLRNELDKLSRLKTQLDE
jgi:hypothetical protein